MDPTITCSLPTILQLPLTLDVLTHRRYRQPAYAIFRSHWQPAVQKCSHSPGGQRGATVSMRWQTCEPTRGQWHCPQMPLIALTLTTRTQSPVMFVGPERAKLRYRPATAIHTFRKRHTHPGRPREWWYVPSQSDGTSVTAPCESGFRNTEIVGRTKAI